MLPISIISNDSKTLYRQVYESLRESILTRRLRVGTRLPSTRLLAKELNVSRNTVINAFEQLIAEGFLIGKQGAGTFVADELPDDLLKFRISKSLDKKKNASKNKISRRGQRILDAPFVFSFEPQRPCAFALGVGTSDPQSIKIWKRTASKNLRKMSRLFSSHSETAGYFPLREAIAEYLGASRGIRCEASQIIITSGAQQGVDLTARILVDENDEVWVEDPNYPENRGALIGAGVKIIPVPLDKEGINLTEGARRSARPRAVYITPSSQFPLGTVMSLARRLEILEWAERENAWIVEDDENNEFRFDGKPLAALQGLDTTGKVIYIGTFTRALFPSLCLGYVVVPPNLVAPFKHALAFTTSHTPLFEQVVLNDFIREGHFGRHIRRIKTLYVEKQRYLKDLIANELGEFIEVKNTNAGMHLIGWLKNGLNDYQIAKAALRKGIYVSPLSSYCTVEKLPDALLFGYTSIEKSEMREAILSLKKMIEEISAR